MFCPVGRNFNLCTNNIKLLTVFQKNYLMFIEPNLKGDRRGWIEVICGSMFSGKTEELIR